MHCHVQSKLSTFLHVCLHLNINKYNIMVGALIYGIRNATGIERHGVVGMLISINHNDL